MKFLLSLVESCFLTLYKLRMFEAGFACPVYIKLVYNAQDTDKEGLFNMCVNFNRIDLIDYAIKQLKISNNQVIRKIVIRCPTADMLNYVLDNYKLTSNGELFYPITSCAERDYVEQLLILAARWFPCYGKEDWTRMKSMITNYAIIGPSHSRDLYSAPIRLKLDELYPS